MRQKLFALEYDIKREIALDGTLEAAEVIRLESGRQAPKSSGRLSKEMVKEHLPKRRSRGRNVDFGGAEAVAVFVGPSKKAWYGVPVHQGWKTKSGRKVPGNRYLQRAFDRRWKDAVRVARQKMGRAIERQATVL